MDQNINIWELLQPEQEVFEEDDLLPALDSKRWITLRYDEAAIGGKKYRIKSRGSPYTDGESQPK
ncbi:MAG: hypothetical protein Q9170_007824, partial [Blastenia crenularia]